MKLRLNGNSLRLRLSQSDVATLAERGRVDETISFPNGPLVYSIESASTATIQALFENNRIRVTLPAAEAQRWMMSDEIGLENPNFSPRILIEKDFQCIHRDSEEDTDGFPNPLSKDS